MESGDPNSNPVCVLLHANALEKDTNPSILPPANSGVLSFDKEKPSKSRKTLN